MVDTQPTTTPDARETFSERLFGGLLGAAEALTIALGQRTGLYAALAEGPLTASELAARTGVDRRYLREWLEQQATAEILDVDDPGAAPEDRRWSLCAPHAEVLLAPDSPYHMGPVGDFVVTMGRSAPDVAHAFTSGGGVPFAAYGPEARHGIAAFNRPTIVNDLADVWLPAAGDVDARLRRSSSPRILDLGCGLGGSSIELARTYAHATVHGVDLDPASVQEARKAAADAGVADRVTFGVADAARWDGELRYDLVSCLEVLHDAGDPVGVLRNARRMLAPGGQVLIAEDRGAPTFGALGDPIERLLYAFSVLHCLPATRAEDHVHAHGTVVRPDDVLGWVTDAGFGRGELLDVDDPMWRLVLATP